ncbi:MAG: hypothetical protein ACREAK_07480 [Nitrosarchaeum sp.]
MAKTKQILVFLPEMATYKRRRQYKCTICGKKSWLQGRRHQLKAFIKKSDQN